MRILLADPEQELTTPFPTSRSHHEWHQVKVAHDGRQALQRWMTWHPDVVIIGTALPGMDPWELVERMGASATTAVLLLSDHNREDEMVRGLESGADAFMSKPVSTAVLLATIDAIVSRYEWRRRVSSSDVVQVGRLVVDPVWHRVTWNEQTVDLTRQQFRIIHLLALSAGRLSTHRQLVDYAWHDSAKEAGAPFSVQVARLVNHVARIRAKLVQAGIRSDPIVAVRGRGYKLTS